ncbi:alpha-glucosidase [Carboxydocella sp. ULO1]|uniref:glycoside hydrolase family 13 protein n=1 Tax=Carboxydocella sp. ULO1 TaxID=1926599 RepID=UPI0009AF1200|nr:alpha-glucosidase [Carboxydocella sp. ULO1]GAW29438.1 alpha-glucosidase [Carboxydocella sp. ULO1]
MKKAWWKEAVVYQIYPRSFMDSNGDGIGDLRGIISKLDYLQELGVNVIWLCPVYKSPNDDNGYDISDYRDIMTEFGTLADWEELLAEVHKRGMKLIMDLVVNHTSDEHPWFIESRKSRDNPYRDYYIWRPGKDGREPNNWRSFFSGSAWEYDETTGEYYLHLFSRKQPDLNWENPRLRAEIYEMMKWWLDKGIDGFRMDVINAISKVPGLPDAPKRSDDPYQWGTEYFINGPRIHEFLQEMKREVLDHYDIMTVGETPFVTPEDAIKYTHEETGTLNMVFQFQHMDVDMAPNSTKGKWELYPWKLTDLKKIITTWQKELEGKGWNSIYLENHDQPRSVSRFADDGEYRVPSAKMLATFLLTLQGTPYIYQGQEIGMTNVKFDSIEDYRDIETLNMYREELAKGSKPEEILPLIHAKGRDNSRTPMQWDASANAGFTSGQPWIKVNPNYREINVEQALQDPDSVFHYYKRLIRLRKEMPVFVYGTYDLLLPEDEQIYAYTRTMGEEKLLVVLNFSAATPLFTMPAELERFSQRQLLIVNYPVNDEESREFRLRPYEARVYRFSNGTDRR